MSSRVCPRRPLRLVQYAMQGVRTRGWSSASKRTLHTALFFPGHGVQRVGMANAWMDHFPRTTASLLEEMDAIVGYSLSRLISDGPNSKLNQTEHAQPAIMAISVLILRVLETEFGFHTSSRVNVTLGHSLGEFAALVAAGHLQFADALRLVRGRAEVMAQCTRQIAKQSGESYGMVALICEPEHLESLLQAIQDFLGLGVSRLDDTSYTTPAIQQVVVANINSPNQVVLSGSIQRIRSLLVQLRQFGGHDPRAVRLKSDSPFHSPMMNPAAEYNAMRFQRICPTIPVQRRPPASVVKTVPDTVRWWDSIRNLHQEKGVKRWIGIGPGKVGRNLVGKEVGRINTKGGGVWAASSPKEMEDMMIALEQTESEAQSAA
ncbi:hypothetical protein N7492_004864 [Penicillium capsulatum]|uniref:[acyl-carrier-protein] S-malonyltransferase n=1 Tax=Penicillium capsulatum TaxID=69766 RepID=A0A9W9LR45_9EURO|nr:hypothetical protein N7492_004864 [Penicillium capsulatum]